MKRKVVLLIGLLCCLMFVNGVAEDSIELLGGRTKENAIGLMNEQLGNEIIGSYLNEGLRAGEAQLDGWYSLSIPQSGKCTVRVKSYNGLVCHFNLRDGNGERIEYGFFGGGFGTKEWTAYTFEAEAGEKYYLHFSRNSADIEWACMFSVCVEGIHKLGDDEKVIQQATCIRDGATGFLCELCGESVISGTIPAVGHQDGIERVTRKADCLQKGERCVCCSVCGEVLSSMEIPLQPHIPGAFVDVQSANCTVGGIRAQYCRVCNATLNTESVEAKGHQAGEWRTIELDTCYHPGRREQWCINCGAILGIEEMPQKKHQYSEWKTILEPTKEVEGEQVRICIFCGDIQMEKIPKIKKFLGVF